MEYDQPAAIQAGREQETQASAGRVGREEAEAVWGGAMEGNTSAHRPCSLARACQNHSPPSGSQSSPSVLQSSPSPTASLFRTCCRSPCPLLALAKRLHVLPLPYLPTGRTD